MTEPRAIETSSCSNKALTSLSQAQVAASESGVAMRAMSCEAIIARVVLGIFKLASSGSSSSWARACKPTCSTPIERGSLSTILLMLTVRKSALAGMVLVLVLVLVLMVAALVTEVRGGALEAAVELLTASSTDVAARDKSCEANNWATVSTAAG